jgi:hypothetical protein
VVTVLRGDGAAAAPHTCLKHAVRPAVLPMTVQSNSTPCMQASRRVMMTLQLKYTALLPLPQRH